MSLNLTSAAFREGGAIPDRYSKSGGNISPPLAWTGVPAGTRSLALIGEDPDAPSGVFVHWLVYGIPPETKELEEGQPETPTLPDGSLQGRNGFGQTGYGGPAPPSGTHRYFFHLFALGRELNLAPGASRKELDEIMQNHVLERAQLMGVYSHHGSGSRAA